MPNGLLNNLFYNLKKKQRDREKLREARAIAGWAHLDKKSGTVGSVKVNNVDVPEAGGIYTPAGDPGASGEYTVTVVVNFAANNSIQNKQYTVKASDSVNAEVSATATITQSAADSNLTVSPEQLTFEATGGAKTITITSNDSWTIA